MFNPVKTRKPGQKPGNTWENPEPGPGVRVFPGTGPGGLWLTPGIPVLITRWSMSRRGILLNSGCPNLPMFRTCVTFFWDTGCNDRYLWFII